MSHTTLPTHTAQERGLASLLLVILVLMIMSWSGLGHAADNTHARSAKRGLVSSGLTADDLATVSPAVSWWYNWSALPDTDLQPLAAQHNIPFVPMIWGNGFVRQQLRQYLQAHPEVHYILGFNEPNFASQANLTPQQAAARWPEIERIADEFDLKIVGPSVNYSAGDVDIPGTDDNGDPYAYIDAFLQACQGCRVDAIALHSYTAAPQYFIEYVQQFHERFDKPIWITEWNLNKGDGTETIEQRMDFMAATVRWMEAQDYISHYAWFIGRNDQDDDLLDAAHQWTALGALYAALPDAHSYVPLPAQIEAEAANKISELHHRTTRMDNHPVIQLFSDTNQASLSFNISSADTRTYNWTLKYATAADAQLTLQLDDQPLQTLTLTSTGSEYFWQQTSQPLTVPAGDHQLTLQVKSGLPNFDWLRFQ